MKKRQMKKWIPKGTPYCHGCRWRSRRNGEAYCRYLRKSDNDIDCGLLWDACKECGEHDTDKDLERDWQRYAKRKYRLSRMKGADDETD